MTQLGDRLSFACGMLCMGSIWFHSARSSVQTPAEVATPSHGSVQMPLTTGLTYEQQRQLQADRLLNEQMIQGMRSGADVMRSLQERAAGYALDFD